MAKDVQDPGTADILHRIERLLNDGKGKQLDENGHEVLDPRPMAPPVGYKRQPTMVEHIRNMVRSELMQRAAGEMDAGTFEEEDDFEVGDDFDPRAPHEAEFEPYPLPTRPPAEPKGPQPQAGEKEPAKPDPIPAAGSKEPPSSSAPPT